MIKTIVNDYNENTYIISEKGEAYIIDPGSKFDLIKEYIDQSKLKVLGILLTHGHFDHLISVNKIIKEYKTKVFIHKLESDFLFNPNLNGSVMAKDKFVIEDKESVIEISVDSIIKLGREIITLLHTPGHTRGSVCFRYKKALFSGDTLFKGTIGRTDLPSSKRSDIERSLKKIVKVCKDNINVYPGHGSATTILDEKRNNPYIKG